MALITKLTQANLMQASVHSEVEATYTIVTDTQGNKYLQLDTYGSKERKIAGKKSQSIRIGPNVMQLLKQVIQNNGL